MKTAISLPDELFRAAERTAARLGLSRSELYAKALAAFVREHDSERLTEVIDTALAGAGEGRIDAVVSRIQEASVGPDEGPLSDWVDPARIAAGRRRRA